MTKYTLKTKYGSFRVTVNEDNHLDKITREVKSIGKLITVGGKNKCVGIQAPYDSTSAHLLNINRTIGGCELDNIPIRGEKTVGMLYLAFTILKKEMPHILYIDLEDKSDFPCTRTDSSTVGISLALYDIMFHQMSWYERHCKAYLINPKLLELYMAGKENFKQKPLNFDFNNKDLNEILKPILLSSESWEYFFATVYTMENRCEIIFPWYYKALSNIFNSISFERQNWRINMDTVTVVEYEIIDTQTGGKYTRRNYFNKLNETYKTWADFTYDEMYMYPYDYLLLDRWAFETGSLRGKAPQFVPSNDSAASAQQGQRAFEMPVGLKD